MASASPASPPSSGIPAPSGDPVMLDAQTKGADSLPTVQWDRCLLTFFGNAGLTECCKAFELDMLVMSQENEQERVPAALGQLFRDLTIASAPGHVRTRELEERKMDYLRTTRDPIIPKGRVASISRFLAQSRARNDRSNRSEFLRHAGTHVPPLPPDDDVGMDGQEVTAGPSSAARTAAKPIDRDIQMQYDIVKNVEGPLRRTTTKGKEREVLDTRGQGTGGRVHLDGVDPSISTVARHSGLEERFRNIEEHLAVRYVPGPPEDIFHRVKALEDHVIRLEKEYPPWAALHFKQPQRGWPPPPRATPIIIPPHLTALERAHSMTGAGTPPEDPSAAGQQKLKKAKVSRGESSLRRAVMEKLEVQNALNELQGRTTER